MPGDESETQWIAQAAAGGREALERLLLLHGRRLSTRIARKIPETLRGGVSPEDVLQDTFLEAFRRIGTFEPRGADAFYHWLATIAEHRLLDRIKGHKRDKRGGGRARLEAAPTGDAAQRSVVIALLEQVAVHERTPSRSAAGHEAVAAVRTALAELRAIYRQVLQMRYVEGLPAAAVAAKLGRSERAVHNLCRRALSKLEETLGRSSKYLTRK